MPKPLESSALRRVLMQSIMWLILAATVGLAALVDVHKSRATTITLGEPRRIEDFSLRFPQGWDSDVDERHDADAALELREPTDDPTARILDVKVEPPSLSKVIESIREQAGSGVPQTRSEIIPFGDGSFTLRVYQQELLDPVIGEPFYAQRAKISRPLRDGRTLTLLLTHPGVRGSQREQNQDIDLMTRVAATLQTNLK